MMRSGSVSVNGTRIRAALARYERVRFPRASRVQEASRGRIAHHHLPDGPEQVARDAAFAGEDPLSHNGWLYGYDAEQAAAAVPPGWVSLHPFCTVTGSGLHAVRIH